MTFEDRYQVVRKGYWWQVKIGDGERTIGKCYTETEAQRLAAELLTAFHDGLFLAQAEIKAAVEAERRRILKVVKERFPNRDYDYFRDAIRARGNK